MRVRLLDPDRDFEPRLEPPWNAAALTQDLELEILLQAMAGGDAFLLDVARRVVLTACTNDVDTVCYRQQVLHDCLRHPQPVRQLYDLALEALEAPKAAWFGIASSNRHSGSQVASATRLLRMLVPVLRRLRELADAHGDTFSSPGLRSFCARLRQHLSADYLAAVDAHLATLRLRRGVLFGAGLGAEAESAAHVLRRPDRPGPGWLQRLLRPTRPAYTFRLAERDMAGHRILADLRDRGLSRVGQVLSASAEHILAFCTGLRAELAFYLGGLNLHARLAAKGEPVTFPRPAAAGVGRYAFRGLYDVCLALQQPGRVVGNTVDASGHRALLITGANQGGKSTFLRGLGVAQLMLQAGLFVGAESFEGDLCPALCTHFRCEEDAHLERGKLDEELARFSELVDRLVPHALLLCNESFAATHEREGSEIARQVVTGLLAAGVRLGFVTHLSTFAQGLAGTGRDDLLCLRADPEPDGTRTFRLTPGQPLQTSRARDLYRQVFGDPATTPDDPSEPVDAGAPDAGPDAT